MRLFVKVDSIDRIVDLERIILGRKDFKFNYESLVEYFII